MQNPVLPEGLRCKQVETSASQGDISYPNGQYLTPCSLDVLAGECIYRSSTSLIALLSQLWSDWHAVYSKMDPLTAMNAGSLLCLVWLARIATYMYICAFE